MEEKDSKVASLFELLLHKLTSNDISQVLILQDTEGQTLVHLAALNDYLRTIQLLLKLLSSDQLFNILSKQDAKGSTALHRSVSNPLMLEVLIKPLAPSQQIAAIDIRDNRERDVIALAKALRDDFDDYNCVTFPEKLRKTAEDCLAENSKTKLSKEKQFIYLI